MHTINTRVTKLFTTQCLASLITICLFIFSGTIRSEEIIPAPEADPHYTKVGFFDIHVCTWPDKPLFFLTLFSTYKYKDVASVEIFTPDGKTMGTLNPEKFRLIKKKGKPDKRVFIRNFDVPKKTGNGWYTATITMKNGKKYRAQDYIIIQPMGRAEGMNPPDKATDIAIPKNLTWNKIPGAKHYKVFIRDLWEEKVIHESKLLNKPELAVPKGVLKPGGYYSWRIHARDVNENALLGDFNHGSLNSAVEFSVAE